MKIFLCKGLQIVDEQLEDP